MLTRHKNTCSIIAILMSTACLTACSPQTERGYATKPKAVQKAMDDNEITEMSHGGIAGVCGMMSDPMPNLMPVGASENEVADDISIMISEGEYVLPANVVKWHGLKHIMDMQYEVEMGLMMMHDIGLIQEVDRETESGSKGTQNAKVSDESDTEQEETEKTIETPEGN